MAEKITLDDMIDGGIPTRRSAPISIDVTKGVPTEIPTNDDNKEQTKKNLTAVPTHGNLNTDSIKEVEDIYSILPKKEKEDTSLEAELYGQLDAAIEREKKNISERQRAIMEAIAEEEEKKAEEAADVEEEEYVEKKVENPDTYSTIDDDLFDDDLDYNDYSNTNATKSHVVMDTSVKTEIINTDSIETPDATKISNDNTSNNEPIIEQKSTDIKNASILDGISDDGLFDEEDENNSDNSIDQEAMLESLKKDIKAKILPMRKGIDLTKFTIAQKAINVQKVMKLALRDHQNIADWMMYYAARPISVTGLSGQEILKLNPENVNRNRLNTFRDMYRIIYDHIYDANKPEYEAWLKQIRFIDLPHIYFALYMATFGGSNFVTYTCPHCNKVFIKDITFEDMVIYKDENVRNKVRGILKSDTTTKSDTYDVELAQISDSYVFGFRAPSVWNVIIETASLSDKFLEKHADLIDVVSYIDAIYVIDNDNNTLVPVDVRPDPNDQAKSSARRVKAFYDIIRTLNSEDYYTLRAKIAEFDEATDNVTYQIPASTCPDCATEIPANTDIGPDAMLFTRHQLAAIGNMSN